MGAGPLATPHPRCLVSAAVGLGRVEGDRMDRSTLESAIRARAQRHPGSGARPLSDVNGALADEFGIDLPPEVSVRVIEETPSEVVLALPPAIDPNAPIPESDLAGVAGGSS